MRSLWLSQWIECLIDDSLGINQGYGLLQGTYDATHVQIVCL